MSNFEKITASPETLGEFLASLSVADGPWDKEFHRMFCDSCERENCDGKRCPHKAERNNPLWWLNRAAEDEAVGRRPVWRNGMLNLEPGAIIPLENPLKVYIRVKDRESLFGQMLDDEGAGEKLEVAWKVVKKVKKAHPDAVISVSVDV